MVSAMSSEDGYKILKAVQEAHEILKAWGMAEVVSNRVLSMESCKADEAYHKSLIIFDIHHDLARIFENDANVEGFMNMVNENPYFLGQSPLERISTGTMYDLEECAKRIKALSMAG